MTNTNRPPRRPLRLRWLVNDRCDHDDSGDNSSPRLWRPRPRPPPPVHYHQHDYDHNQHHEGNYDYDHLDNATTNMTNSITTAATRTTFLTRQDRYIDTMQENTTARMTSTRRQLQRPRQTYGKRWKPQPWRTLEHDDHDDLDDSDAKKK